MVQGAHVANQPLDTYWGAAVEIAVCEQCDWRYLALEGMLPSECPYCFQPALAQVDELPYTHSSELILPFSVSTERVSQGFAEFKKGMPFAPRDLNPQNLNTRLQRIYLPMWLVDSDVAAEWKAEVGFDYQVVSHQDQYNQNRGGWTSRQIEEGRIRWEPRIGRLRRTYHNVSAPALEEDRRIKTGIGEFDLDKASEYHLEALKGALVRLPDREPEDAWEAVKPSFQTLAARECQQAAGGDHIRSYSWKPEYSNRNWTLLLLPLLSTYYLDDESRPQRVWIQGRTGRVYGLRRASMKRARQVSLILLLVALLLFLISAGISAASLLLPVLLAIGGIGLAISLVVGLGAAFPVATVWWFNRRQPDRPETSR